MLLNLFYLIFKVPLYNSATGPCVNAGQKGFQIVVILWESAHALLHEDSWHYRVKDMLGRHSFKGNNGLPNHVWCTLQQDLLEEIKGVTALIRFTLARLNVKMSHLLWWHQILDLYLAKIFVFDHLQIIGKRPIAVKMADYPWL